MQLMEYLPPFFSKVREYQAINEALQPEIDLLRLRAERYRKDMYLETLTEEGCKHWETIMNIVPSGTATLEDRRNEIITKYNEKLPHTWNKLIVRLDTMLGEGTYYIEEKRAQYILYLKVPLKNKSQYIDVYRMLDLAVPLEVILDVEQVYNSHAILHAYTHAELAARTHKDIREEVFE